MLMLLGTRSDTLHPNVQMVGNTLFEWAMHFLRKLRRFSPHLPHLGVPLGKAVFQSQKSTNQFNEPVFTKTPWKNHRRQIL